MVNDTVPSLVGYTVEEAEAAAAEWGRAIIWLDAPAPRWLPPQHAPRVGRQRVRPDGTLELLRMLVPLVKETPPA